MCIRDSFRNAVIFGCKHQNRQAVLFADFFQRFKAIHTGHHHIDVYKRQEWVIVPQIDNSHIDLRFGVGWMSDRNGAWRGAAPRGAAPVSYTHLDVYKRQDLNYTEESYINPIIQSDSRKKDTMDVMDDVQTLSLIHI